MNQIVKIFQDSNKLLNQVMQNKFDEKQINAALRLFDVQIKSANVVIQAYAVSSKYQRTIKGLERMNIMDDTVAIDLGLGDPALDKVKCQLKEGEIIYRTECLELNGEEKNYPTCRACVNKGVTARMLLDCFNNKVE